MQNNLKDLPNDGKWIFAYLYDGEYCPEGIVNLDSLDNLEYIDVKNNEYQLWHWPSGDIYSVDPDREVESKDEYATPYGSKGIIWLPKFTKIATDKEKIDTSLQKFSSQRK
jgi:hypothetical protein